MIRKILLVISVAFVTYHLSTAVISLGFHKHIVKHHPGPCKVLDSINHGSEDMERIPGDKVLITSGLRFISRHNKKFSGRKGRVFLFDFNDAQQGAQPVALKDFSGADTWDPHGLTVWLDDGEVIVSIVNHLENQSVVEVFTYKDDDRALYHKETIEDDSFRLLNDLVAVGRRQYYVTNFLYTRQVLEHLLMLKWGSVVYYNGQTGHVVLDGFHTPNGINISPDGRYIYLAHIGDRALNIYTKEADNSLTLKEIINLYTAADNIIVDPETGDLLIGCHAVGYKTMLYMEAWTQKAPSQVLQVRVSDGSVKEVTEVLLDDGTLISASSVAVYANNKLLIGSIRSETVVCDVQYMA